jgi:hypothetical protein
MLLVTSINYGWAHAAANTNADGPTTVAMNVRRRIMMAPHRPRHQLAHPRRDSVTRTLAFVQLEDARILVLVFDLIPAVFDRLVHVLIADFARVRDEVARPP